MSNFKINPNVIANVRKSCQAALTEAKNQAAIACHKALEAEVYEWPRQTIRSDGSIAGSPRDIIDTRTLYNSQRVTRNGIFYADSKAMAVHEGEIDAKGRVKPARRWTIQAIRGYPNMPTRYSNPDAFMCFPEVYRLEFRRAWNGLSS